MKQAKHHNHTVLQAADGIFFDPNEACC